jgi:hypothetical protein
MEIDFPMRLMRMLSDRMALLWSASTRKFFLNKEGSVKLGYESVYVAVFNLTCRLDGHEGKPSEPSGTHTFRHRELPTRFPFPL